LEEIIIKKFQKKRGGKGRGKWWRDVLWIKGKMGGVGAMFGCRKKGKILQGHGKQGGKKKKKGTTMWQTQQQRTPESPSEQRGKMKWYVTVRKEKEYGGKEEKP